MEKIGKDRHQRRISYDIINITRDLSRDLSRQ